MPTFITTDTGEIITTTSGVPIVLTEPTENADIQIFDFSVNLLRALLWEYNDATNLQGLLEQKQAWYDANERDFWQNWITNVFDLRTCNEFGLRVWSIILGLNLFVNSPPDSLSKPTFGFDSPFYKNFGRGNFSNFSNGGSVVLSTEMKRLALRLRYFQLVSSGTVPETNRMLAYLFADMGQVYLLDGYNMTQVYVFRFTIPSALKYLLDNFDILPRPAAVSSRYLDATKKYFGFGPYGLNFDNGNFGA